MNQCQQLNCIVICVTICKYLLFLFVVHGIVLLQFNVINLSVYRQSTPPVTFSQIKLDRNT